MKNVNFETNRKIVLASIFAGGSVIAVFLILFFLSTEDSRLPASADGVQTSENQTQVLNAIQIKTEMIQAIEWTTDGDKKLFRIPSPDRDFCMKWENAKVVLKADGVAVSGESPSGEMAADCLNGQFEIRWPTRRSEWDRQVVMRGDFSVDPMYFYIDRIEIRGPLGDMIISNAELLTVRGQSFDLEISN